jgi:hypothetical protein
MRWKCRATIVGLLVLFQYDNVFAHTFDVKRPEVERGVVELGLDNTVQWGLPRNAGANRTAHDQSIDWGVRDWWKLSGVFKLERPDGETFRNDHVAVENLFVLKAVDDKRAIDAGLGWFAAVELSTHRHTTNVAVFGPVVAIKADKLSLAVNPFLQKSFGRNRTEGLDFTYGWQVKYDVREGFAVGIEGFGVVENVGHAPRWTEQEHRIGPVIYKEIEIAKGVRITPDIGLLFGLTKATPDVALKFNVGIPLHKQAANGK